MYKSLCVTILALGILNNVYTQSSETQKNMWLDAKIHYGTILPHYTFMNYITSKHQKGIEMSLRTQCNTYTLSSFLYRYPRYGIGLNHTSLGNPEKIGNTTVLFGIFDVPVFHRKHVSLLYQCNLGAAYIHKPLSSNIHNIAMSNSYNFFIGIDLQAEYRIGKKHAIRTGIDASHISNGKITTPNLGYNSISANCSYIYTLHKTPTDFTLYNTYSISPVNMYTITASGGIKSDEYLSSEHFPTASLNIEYHRIFNMKYGLIIGTDMFYDNAKQAKNSVWKEEINGGIHAGVEAFYVPFSFTIQTGWYLIHKPEQHATYQRIALRYYGLQSYTIQFGLKSHMTTADFLEIGIGYTLPNIRKHVSQIEHN
ncbi:MAG: acyloxyacyl hydrolase [Bacteroidales bacterium]